MITEFEILYCQNRSATKVVFLKLKMLIFIQNFVFLGVARGDAGNPNGVYDAGLWLSSTDYVHYCAEASPCPAVLQEPPRLGWSCQKRPARHHCGLWDCLAGGFWFLPLLALWDSGWYIVGQFLIGVDKKFRNFLVWNWMLRWTITLSWWAIG